MKIDLYVDVWPGNDPNDLTAYTKPYRKPEGCRRFQIRATIPDDAFTDMIDGSANVISIIEMDCEDNS